MKLLTWLAILAGLTVAACSRESDDSSKGADWQRGRAVYVANCVACHNNDPSKDGPIGPAIKGSSKELIEARVRPAVANDGGDITFRGFRDGVVYLDMKGACSGCPSSTATLRHGIQNLLRHYLPDVIEVRPVA